MASPARVFTGFVLFVALAAGLASCCPSRECAVPKEDGKHYRLADNGSLTERMARLVEKHAHRHGAADLNILVLSGGGSNGAWGAGVLNGWRDHGRPKSFHVVTGISTGALLSTFAYLGTKKDDDILREVYTGVDKEDILEERSWLRVVRSNSLYTTGPLRRLIEKHITADVLKRVEDEYRTTCRELLVGTVNMDTGVFKPWFLSELAAGEGEYKGMTDEARLELYRTVVLASTAIPVFFPPVMINGEMHVDGGAREQLFIRKALVAVATAHDLECKQKGGLKKKAPGGDHDHDHGAKAPHPCAPTIYVVVNGQLGTTRKCVDNCIDKIALRTLQVLLDENIIGNLFRTKYFAHERGLNFQLCYIPKDKDLGFKLNEDSHDFDQTQMKRLFDKGLEWGSEAKWLEMIPGTDDVEEVKEKKRALIEKRNQ